MHFFKAWLKVKVYLVVTTLIFIQNTSRLPLYISDEQMKKVTDQIFQVPQQPEVSQ